MSINELRLVLTVEDFNRATALFRDALGLKQLVAWHSESAANALRGRRRRDYRGPCQSAKLSAKRFGTEVGSRERDHHFRRK
jgi:hypothetical protein